MFKRRARKPVLVRLRDAFYPRTGWRRATRYYRHRVSRIPDTPHRIALGFSCGALVSFTPFFGFHFVVAAALAWILRGNILASLIGTAVGNPLTFPIIASVSLNLGRRILGYGVTGRDFGRVTDALQEGASALWQSLLSLVGLGESAWDRLLPLLTEMVLPWFVGGLLPGIATAIAFYYVLRPIIGAYQGRRRLRMLARARERVKEARARAGADAAD